MGRTEIGSEFWEIPVCDKKNNLFEHDAKWFLSGRHALEYIIIDSEIKNISMPRWCCESMINPFRKHNVRIDFYDSEPNYSCDAVLIMDYFGFTNNKSYNKLFKYKGIVIRDLTQSLFSKKYNDADYYFGSLRKWAGFYTGGYAWGHWKKNIPIPSVDNRYLKLREEAMKLKKAFIEKKIEDKDYLNVYKEANDMLNELNVCAAYPDDIKKAEYLDVDFIKSKRRNNARVLIKELQLDVELNDSDVPLFVPIFIEKRNELRKFLIDNDIYCPVHWPNYDVNGTELSLICDQRYDENEMMRMVRLIKKFKEDDI